jgi:hypothetical protein
MKKIATNTQGSFSKMEPAKKKLVLHRETIRQLDEAHLKIADGGVEKTVVGAGPSESPQVAC